MGMSGMVTVVFYIGKGDSIPEGASMIFFM